MHSVSTVGQNELFWKIRHFISKWCNSRYCVFVFAYLCICVFVFGLRCLKPGQKFRKFNSDHFPFFKNLKRTSGAKVRSFPTLVKKWQFTPVLLLLLLKDRNIKKIVKIHSLIDDHWWSLMMIDDHWCSLIIIDGHWWWLMMIDDGWWWLISWCCTLSLSSKTITRYAFITVVMIVASNISHIIKTNDPNVKETHNGR